MAPSLNSSARNLSKLTYSECEFRIFTKILKSGADHIINLDITER